MLHSNVNTAVEKNPFVPLESWPNKTSPAVTLELLTKLAKYLFSFLLKLFAKILVSKASKSFNEVAFGGLYFSIGTITSPELAVKDDSFQPSLPS